MDTKKRLFKNPEYVVLDDLHQIGITTVKNVSSVRENMEKIENESEIKIGLRGNVYVGRGVYDEENIKNVIRILGYMGYIPINISITEFFEDVFDYLKIDIYSNEKEPLLIFVRNKIVITVAPKITIK